MLEDVVTEAGKQDVPRYIRRQRRRIRREQIMRKREIPEKTKRCMYETTER